MLNVGLLYCDAPIDKTISTLAEHVPEIVEDGSRVAVTG